MCFSRHIYNFFLWSCDPETAVDLTETSRHAHAAVTIKLVFGNYIITFQITAAERTKHHALELNFHTALFSSRPVVITINMENVFLFVLSLVILSFLLWTGKYHACF